MTSSEPSAEQKAVRQTILYLDHTAKISGGEIALLNLIKALDQSRYTPVVVLASGGPLVEQLRAEGVETHVLPLPLSVVNTRKDSLGLSSLARLRQAWLCIIYAIRLAAWARRRRVDLIHTNTLKADLYGGLAGRLAGIPVLWHVRDRIADGYLPRPVAAAFRRLARVMPRAVVTNSESTMRCLCPVPGPARDAARMHIVHDGFDPAQFTHLPAPSVPQQAEQPIIALVGRISPWKGQHVFLEAAAAARRAYPHARFWVVGAALFEEHEYEQSLHSLVAKHGLEDSVEFLGFQSDIPGILAQADVVVHASTLGEPFGQVVIEGMAAGRPVIATNGGALPEIIQNGQTGLLVPMDDAAQMAGAMEWLLANPARAREIGLAGQAQAHLRFTSSHVARNIEVVYAKILDHPGQFPARGLPALVMRAARRAIVPHHAAREGELAYSVDASTP